MGQWLVCLQVLLPGMLMMAQAERQEPVCQGHQMPQQSVRMTTRQLGPAQLMCRRVLQLLLVALKACRPLKPCTADTGQPAAQQHQQQQHLQQQQQQQVWT
jgi:hypothetical protein